MSLPKSLAYLISKPIIIFVTIGELVLLSKTMV